MPIPQVEINTNWVWASADETVGQVLAKLPPDRNERAFRYVVIPLASGRYIAVRWVEVEQIATMMKQDIQGLKLSTLQGLPQPVEAVEQNSMGINDARETRDLQPGKRLVILSNGTVIGLLTVETLDAVSLQSDPFAMQSKAPIPTILGIEDDVAQSNAPLPEAAGDVAPAEPQEDRRVLQNWIEGLRPTDPLQVRQTYELKFNVDEPRADARGTFSTGKTLTAMLAPDQDLLEILIVLEPGDDFTLYGLDQQVLVMPRVGRSKNTALFTIEPKKEGTASLNVIMYVNNRQFQRSTLSFQVGGASTGAKTTTVTTTGITLASAAVIPPRDRGAPVNVMIIKRDEGYQFIVQGGGVARALLRITDTQVSGWLRDARKNLLDIVMLQANGKFVYQQDDTFIPPDTHADTLKKLADVGFRLYDGLFFGGNGPDVQNMGRLLAELSQKHQLYIQVAGDRFFFPWSMLYDGDDPTNPDPQRFWGFRHIIEYTPEFSLPTTVGFDPTIAIGDTLDIAFVCNKTIDTQFKRDIIASQSTFLSGLQGVSVKEYPNINDLLGLLKSTDAAPLIYINCHADSKIPEDGGSVIGVDDSALALTDGKIALRQLKSGASTRLPLMGNAPLIYLNACESAELSPYLYDGLVPYLIQRGARGVLGTEVKTPALFAAEFAKDFLKRFAAGDQPLGDLLLDLRKEYLEQKNNVMGLVYALYSSGDVVVKRAT